jgi:fatty acid desaturase
MAAYTYFVLAINWGWIGTTWFDLVVVVICVSLQGTSNTCVGHELYHRRNKICKFFGMISHLKFLSGHIPIFHNELHHKHTGIVAKDPGFTPKGTTVYEQFSPLGCREKLYTLKYDDARLKKRGMHSMFERVLNNRIVQMTIIEIIFVFALYHFFGWKVLVF